MARYDLIAIGGGTAGLVTAAGAASLGLRVALVERVALGGDCLWTGCVPSKALLASAKLVHQMRHAERLGLVGAPPRKVFEKVMARMRSARAQVAEHDDPRRFERLGVDVLFGNAELRSGRQVVLNGRTLEAKRVVIATGAEAVAPPIPGLRDAGVLTHATALDQNHLPEHVVIVGGGPIGLEFAQVYRRLGAQVTVVERLDRLLQREEPEVSEAARRHLEAEGVVVHLGTRVEHVQRNGVGTVLKIDGDVRGEMVVDTVFVATGRRPNTAGLGLESAGVALDGPAIKVDRALRTTVPGIWAAGDVVGGPQFTHVADYHAKLVLRNAVFPFVSKLDYSAIPAVTYLDPEVARVGLTEAQARERYRHVRTYRADFADLDRAIVDGRPEGFVKVVTVGRGRILGAVVVAGGAGDLLVPLVLAMKRRMALPQLARIVYPYPTMAEGIKRAAEAYYRERLAGRAGTWLRRIVRWMA
jgi:pyruvate/2-oxoglutarate dehydrogenase complex dihydrolipoamide dehydrogenase (E3) component